jgi:hypothetical protein
VQSNEKKIRTKANRNHPPPTFLRGRSRTGVAFADTVPKDAHESLGPRSPIENEQKAYFSLIENYPLNSHTDFTISSNLGHRLMIVSSFTRVFPMHRKPATAKLAAICAGI